MKNILNELFLSTHALYRLLFAEAKLRRYAVAYIATFCLLLILALANLVKPEFDIGLIGVIIFYGVIFLIVDALIDLDLDTSKEYSIYPSLISGIAILALYILSENMQLFMN